MKAIVTFLPLYCSLGAHRSVDIVAAIFVRININRGLELDLFWKHEE